MTLTI